MSTHAPGVLCIVRLRNPQSSNNGAIVELVKLIGPVPGWNGNDWWQITCPRRLWAYNTQQWHKPGQTDIAIRQIHLIPISGPSIPLSEVTPLYSPCPHPNSIPSSVK